MSMADDLLKFLSNENHPEQEVSSNSDHDLLDVLTAFSSGTRKKGRLLRYSDGTKKEFSFDWFVTLFLKAAFPNNFISYIFFILYYIK